MTAATATIGDAVARRAAENVKDARTFKTAMAAVGAMQSSEKSGDKNNEPKNRRGKNPVRKNMPTMSTEHTEHHTPNGRDNNMQVKMLRDALRGEIAEANKAIISEVAKTMAESAVAVEKSLTATLRAAAETNAKAIKDLESKVDAKLRGLEAGQELTWKGVGRTAAQTAVVTGTAVAVGAAAFGAYKGVEYLLK